MALFLYREQHLAQGRCPESVGWINSPAPHMHTPQDRPHLGDFPPMVPCHHVPMSPPGWLILSGQTSPPPKALLWDPNPNPTPHQLFIYSCSQHSSLSDTVTWLWSVSATRTFPSLGPQWLQQCTRAPGLCFWRMVVLILMFFTKEIWERGRRACSSPCHTHSVSSLSMQHLWSLQTPAGWWALWSPEEALSS